MFERFRAAFAPRRDNTEAATAWVHERLAGVEGYQRFALEFAGASFDGGLYRVHDDRSGPNALVAIADAFPELAARACPFGYDWLGRQLAVDVARLVDGQPQILLLEPGTGEALEIPVSFAAFHDEEVIDHGDAALAARFFRSWASAHPECTPLPRDQCVGYKVPLFLGGTDDLENLEVTDLDVYWAICTQLRRQS